MKSWKTNPLYRLIFARVEALRERLHQADSASGVAPDGFRIEERSSPDWSDSTMGSGVRHVWILDQFGPRLFPGLRNYPFDPGELRGSYWQYGLVRFFVGEDGTLLFLEIDLGPGQIRNLDFEIVGSGEEIGLNRLEESLSGIF